MHVPFISKRSDRKLYRRKGGGRGGGGRSGGSSGGSSGGRSVPVSSGGTTKSATAFGAGGGAATVIGAGQLFAGRTSGGGTRQQVVGTRTYGSGYPGHTGRGVGGLGFPFVFWPLAWGGVGLGGSALYLHNTEYGRWDNSSRPGGVQMTAAFSSSSQNTTFRLMTDQASLESLIDDIVDSCRDNLSSPDNITATNYDDTVAAPKPEQAVQYYRASSVVLTLDGYNNTGALGPEGTPDTPLPTDIDNNLLSCLNETIAEAVPLVDAANLRWPVPSSTGLLGLAYLVWCLSGSI
ncbi:unnamed protein product [Cyclocybe aegerita]|uniref:Uncharacterized protein n=1 Tax=Cyclocybe aegerita TaxID=1973307 RepID=A0A8S0VV62_CYCAE|nr:unnamed protein product [Cyclocybe aegerita]